MDHDIMSVKFQMVLPEDLAAELKSASGRLGIPVAEFIRGAVQARLDDARRLSPDDPFDSITGLIEGEDPNLSDRVDDILYR